jgi:glycosyltransferase involved in cell wall biosynthesis
MRKKNVNEELHLQQTRAYVKGKFLYIGKNKFYVKGTTYGTFAPDETGSQFPCKETVRKDFALMAEHGFNSVRTYTVPPKYLLDLALEYDLKVMVGLPWEQHITFLDESSRKNDIIKRVKESVASCGRHPAILCFAVGNEIPAPIVRWYGKNKIEHFLKQLYLSVKEADRESLVTYVNYPTTEYLDLSFLDFDCFNVYLETPEKLSAYISRLHNLSGDRPLVLAEIGLDSQRNGEDRQAEILKWQIETIFGKGCAGMFVFAWTDEWWRGGFEIEDWDFGLVDRERNPKLALFTVAETMHHVPFFLDEFPFISVVVCSYNGSSTIRDTMEGLQKLDYPNYEVIVVNDGSKDQLAEIVKEYPVKLITTSNRGLSNARNTGMNVAKGEIIAYIDDDAYPDPQWLHYLAYAYSTSDHAGIGGPNIVPQEDGPIAKCVANAPGGPVHVLVTDEIAEHIPGCNMSFRKDALMKIGGFDPVYCAAGDDVDVCWRIQQSGRTIGFHPSALVWHHRRNSVKTYWKQQKGYGKAEALLEAKWPEKYNSLGHYGWAGRIYGNGFTLAIKTKKGKIFHGTWGTALFQSVYQPANGFISSIPLMPEWYLLTAFITFIASLGFIWAPLLWFWAVVVFAVSVVLFQAAVSASKNSALTKKDRTIKAMLLITCLHILQPIARLYGRLTHGLTPWRIRGVISVKPKYLFALGSRKKTCWSEEWKSSETWLEEIELNLINKQARVKRGGEFDRWDIQARSGLFSHIKMLLAIEEHGAGKQLLRLKTRFVPSEISIILFILFGIISCISALDGAYIASGFFGLFALVTLVEYFKSSASVLSKFDLAVSELNSNNAKVVVMQEASETHMNNEMVLEEAEIKTSLRKKMLIPSPSRIINGEFVEE